VESVAQAPAMKEAAGYEPPRLEMHGSVAEVTKMQVVGVFIDKANLPAGTPIFGNSSL
jgi:hypothetical protein